MRRDYMKPQPRLVPKNNGGGGGGGSKVEADMNEIHNRFAKLQNKPVEEVKDPRILITGKDENGQVPTGAKVLDSFKEDKPTTSNESAPKTDQAKSITVEEIEERLAALRGVPVIRKPRLMVVDDDEEDDVEMPDEAVQLLKEAEKAAIKRKAPSSAYDNHGMQTGEENDMAENRESTTFKKILKECEDTPSVASSISSYNPLPNFAEQCRQ
uniref:Uncharacterized protein n=1 Tax=Panagrolaimus sp. JU765 TaxID=591449 RepID=A0AC34Q7X4_9BILA